MAEDNRSRTMSFSSENAVVPRWFGGEILDHSPKAMRMNRINSGTAPLRVKHDTNAQPVGVIEKGSVKVGNKVGRASVRFGNTQAANDALRNVDDKILVNTSVGYRVHEMRFDSEQNGQDVYRVVDWEPHEVSLVGVPADPSVGMDRGMSEAEIAATAASGSQVRTEPQTPAAKPHKETTVSEVTSAAAAASTETRAEILRQEIPAATAIQLEAMRKRT